MLKIHGGTNIVDETGKEIAQTCNKAIPLTQESYTYARLFRAAPEMLETLKECVNYFKGFDSINEEYQLGVRIEEVILSAERAKVSA